MKQLKDGETALHVASNNGSLATVELLLEIGADIHACKNDGRTALHSASTGGHTDIVKKLLEKGADIMKKERDGWTALHRITSHRITVHWLP